MKGRSLVFGLPGYRLNMVLPLFLGPKFCQDFRDISRFGV